MLHKTSVFLSVVLASVVGCGGPAGGGDDDPIDPDDPSFRRIDTSVFLETFKLDASAQGPILNGLFSFVLSAPSLLADGPILNGLASEELLSDGETTVGEASRAVLAYVYSCAMPLGTNMVVEIDGEDWIFEGQLGLAPEWEEGECGAECQEWVSACVLARTNQFGKKVFISLRGDHPALQPSPQTIEDYSLREGSYYGNIFQGQILDHAYACAGGKGGAIWELTSRFCSQIGDDCPITTVADCNVQEFACNPNLAACNTNTACSQWGEDGNPLTCHSESHNCGEAPTASAGAYSRVITAYIQPPAPSCGDGICGVGESLTCADDCSDHWAVNFGSGCHEDSGGIAADGAGNVAVAGRFVGDMTIGGTALATDGDTDQDLFVAKLDSTGAAVWAKQLEAAGTRAMARSVAMDSSGAVFVAGHFDDAIDFESNDVITPQSFSYFIAKYDTNGNLIRAIELVGNQNVFGSSLAALPMVTLVMDNAGGVVVAASFEGTVDLGPSNVVATSQKDIFVAQFDSSLLTLQGSALIFGTSDELVQDVEVDSAGNVLVAGRYSGQLRSGGQTLTGDVSSLDGFVVKLSSGDLNTVWAKKFGGPDVAAVNGVTAGSGGSVAVTGQFVGTATLPGPSAPQLTADPDSNRAFVAKLDVNGDTEWAKSYGSPDRASNGIEIDFDAQDNSFVAALTVSALPGVYVDVEGTAIEPGEYQDIVLVRYRPDGEATHMLANGSSVRERPSGLVANDGQVALSGEFLGTLKFTGTYLTNAGGSSATPRPGDIFVTWIAALPELPPARPGPTARELEHE